MYEGDGMRGGKYEEIGNAFYSEKLHFFCALSSVNWKIQGKIKQIVVYDGAVLCGVKGSAAPLGLHSSIAANHIKKYFNI